MAILTVVFAFLPFGLASTVADTSDKADNLRMGINKKRGKDLPVHHELAALEAYMDNENRAQGLGFVVFGVVIDKVRASPTKWIFLLLRASVRSNRAGRILTIVLLVE